MLLVKPLLIILVTEPHKKETTQQQHTQIQRGLKEYTT